MIEQSKLNNLLAIASGKVAARFESVDHKDFLSVMGHKGKYTEEATEELPKLEKIQKLKDEAFATHKRCVEALNKLTKNSGEGLSDDEKVELMKKVNELAKASQKCVDILSTSYRFSNSLDKEVVPDISKIL